MSWDAIIIGSGAAGLTAAITAARSGLSVLVVEKTGWFGGTTALSGGGIWIPANPHAAAADIPDSIAAARSYIAALVGNKLRADVLDAYLQAGPEMLAFLEANSEVRFALAPHSPDWHPQLPGAAADGRLLRPLEYDAKNLNGLFAELRPPRATFNAPGGFMIDLPDLPHLANATASFKSFRYMARLAARYGWDRLCGYSRGTRLTMGNALVAGLLSSARQAGVTLWRNTKVTGLVDGPDGVSGVRIERAGLTEILIARRGVVLATGGFSANRRLRDTYMPHADQHISITADCATGDGMEMGLQAGGSLDDENYANGVWAVASRLEKANGETAVYAHLIDMAKPGCIAVGKAGTRFGNEAAQEFVPYMHESGNVPAWLVADSRFVKAYGLGMVFPGGMRLKTLLKAGYVTAAPSLEKLGAKLRIDPVGLAATATRMNVYARTGKDPEFQKGETALDREMGDSRHGPNPCLGTIETPPFYAVRIHPGDGSTTVGLRINAMAQVLDARNEPIGNLYAAGLDANSLWRGKAPAHGCNIGPAMVMGYIAARSLSK